MVGFRTRGGFLCHSSMHITVVCFFVQFDVFGHYLLRSFPFLLFVNFQFCSLVSSLPWEVVIWRKTQPSVLSLQLCPRQLDVPLGGTFLMNGLLYVCIAIPCLT